MFYDLVLWNRDHFIQLDSAVKTEIGTCLTKCIQSKENNIEEEIKLHSVAHIYIHTHMHTHVYIPTTHEVTQ